MKEKAKELCIKFTKHCSAGYLSPNRDKSENVEILSDNAKQCALICVDEIIEFINKFQDNACCCEYDILETYLTIEHWQEVKQEIEKL